MADTNLLPCPFCGKAMMLRGALWPSEGDRDGIIHAEPTDCPLYEFSNDTADESIIEVWNRRTPSPSPAPGMVAEEILAAVKRWHDWAFEWSGTAFIADEALPLDAMTDAEHKSELYSGLCKLGNTMAWLHEQLSALASLSQPAKGEREGGE